MNQKGLSAGDELMIMIVVGVLIIIGLMVALQYI